LLLAHPEGAIDAEARLFLVGELLRRGDRSPRALEVFARFLRGEAGSAGDERVTAAVAELRRRSAPRPGSGADPARMRAWNLELARARPDLAWPRAHLGRVEALAQRWGPAAAELTAACRLDPADPASRRLLAYALHRDGRHADALEQLDLADRSAPAPAPRPADLALRAEALRALGRVADASAAFERAARDRRLRRDQSLARAECLIRLGRLAEARSVLDEIEDRGGSAWDLATAALDQAAGRPGLAVGRLTRIRAAPPLGPQVAARLLAAVAELPADRETLAALDVLPESARDAGYWMLRGNLLLVLGASGEALDCWERVDRPVPGFDRALGGLAAAWLADLYRAGRYAEALAAAGRPALRAAEIGAVAPVLATSLARRLASGPPDARAARHGLATLESLESELPALAETRPAALLHGLLQAAAGESEAARAALAGLEAAGELPREGRLQLARCALLAGEPEAAAAALARVSDPGPRVARLKAARAALAGDWQSACSALGESMVLRSGGGEVGEIFLPALLYLARRDDELARAAAGEGEARYYLAAARIRDASPSAADRLSDELEPLAEAAPRWRRLLSWARFQELCRRLAEGGHEAAGAALAAALEAWDGDRGPVEWIGEDLDLVLPVCIATGDRQSLGRVLEGAAAREGPAAAPACHRLGLFHLAEAARFLQAGDAAAAVERWERAIGELCTALASFTYVQAWVERRRPGYGAKIEAEDAVGVDPGAVQRVEALLLRCGESLEGSGGAAAQIADLAVSLHAERAAARVLGDLGGFEDPESGRRISAGPGYLERAGLAGAFGAWVAGLEVRRSRRPDLAAAGNPIELLLQLTEALAEQRQEGAVEPEVKERIERLFSSLRLAAVLAEEGQLERALGHLRRPRPHCFPVADGRRCGGRLRHACAAAEERFTGCNPAFAAPGGRERFARAAAELETSLLVRLGEQAVASAEDRLTEGIGCWREALEAAGEAEDRERVAERIRELVSGRVKVLEARAALDDGIRLLAAARRLVDDGHLRAKHAGLHAARGIQAVNERDAWARGLKDLRRAHKLNPDSTHINLNLILALRGRANDLAGRGKMSEAHELVAGASKRARAQLAADPLNPKLQQLARELEVEERVARFSSASSVEDLLTKMAESTSSRAAESTRVHNQGVRKTERGDLEGAIRDLERAFELEPESGATRQMLTAVLNQRAVELANAKRFEDALRHLRRGLQIDPSSSALQSNLRAISAGQAMERLLSGEARPGDLKDILERLAKGE
jgi:tetratricopeptide (TPR) repeat protein